MTLKKLKEELEEHTALGGKEEATRLTDKGSEKADFVQALMGKPRDLNLPDRALCAFPMLQTIPNEKALQHLESRPNNIFVFKRDNGTCGVVHCWPIKFNKQFQSRFIISEKNPDPAKFSPRMASEMNIAMQKLFGGAKRSGLLACFGGSFFRWRFRQRLFQPLTQVANAILVFVSANITTMIFPDIRKCLSGNALW